MCSMRYFHDMMMVTYLMSGLTNTATLTMHTWWIRDQERERETLWYSFDLVHVIFQIFLIKSNHHASIYLNASINCYIHTTLTNFTSAQFIPNNHSNFSFALTHTWSTWRKFLCDFISHFKPNKSTFGDKN